MEPENITLPPVTLNRRVLHDRLTTVQRHLTYMLATIQAANPNICLTGCYERLNEALSDLAAYIFSGES